MARTPPKPPGGNETTGSPETINRPRLVARDGRREPDFDPNVGYGGEGGEPPDGADVRIAILETHVAHIQGALSDIRNDLRDIASKLGHLPTKQDLTANLAAIVLIGLAVLAIVIGGIIGGLAYLQPKEAQHPAAPVAAIQPIIIQVPYPAAVKPKGG